MSDCADAGEGALGRGCDFDTKITTKEKITKRQRVSFEMRSIDKARGTLSSCSSWLFLLRDLRVEIPGAAPSRRAGYPLVVNGKHKT